MIEIFFACLWLSLFVLLVAVILALVGIFTKDATKKARYYDLSAKFILACALVFAIGFGACFIS